MKAVVQGNDDLEGAEHTLSECEVSNVTLWGDVILLDIITRHTSYIKP